jgi:FlaG/FlaF family flagellin (archaellin)
MTESRAVSDRSRAPLREDDRAVSPVVEKLLVAGIVVLYVGGMGTLLFGGVLPSYEAETSAEMSERVLATATAGIEDAVPATDGYVESRTTVDLPATIGDSSYTILVSGQSIKLVHPDRGIGVETRLAVPFDITVQESRWESGSDLVVEIRGSSGNRQLTVRENR